MPSPFTGPFRTGLRDAIARLAVDAALVPSTHLVGTLTAGGATFEAASTQDAARFRKTGIASFWDGSEEFPAVVESVDGAVVTCSFKGRVDGSGNPLTGWEFGHAANALVATNVMLVPPNNRDATLTRTMCGNGFPVVRVFCPDAVRAFPGNDVLQSVGMVSVVYELPLEQSGADTMPDQLWLQRQTDRADTDLKTLIDAISVNWGLIVDDAYHAEFVDQFIQAGRQNRVVSDVPLYQDFLDIHVVGTADEPPP